MASAKQGPRQEAETGGKPHGGGYWSEEDIINLELSQGKRLCLRREPQEPRAAATLAGDTQGRTPLPTTGSRRPAPPPHGQPRRRPPTAGPPPWEPRRMPPSPHRGNHTGIAAAVDACAAVAADARAAAAVTTHDSSNQI